MKPTLIVLCLGLAAASAGSCAGTDPTGAPTPVRAGSAPVDAGASVPARATRAASAACARTMASAPGFGHKVTSKVRHTFEDGDPCADPHSPPASR